MLVVEDNLSGHRRTYVELLVAAAESLSVRLHVALSSTDPLATDFAASLTCPVHMLSHSALSNWASVANDIDARLVVIPDGDRDVLRLGMGHRWKSRAEVRLLVMRRYAQPRSSRIVEKAVDLTRRALFAVASARPRVRVLFLESAVRPTGNANGVADPITFHPSSHAPVDLPGDRFWFGIVGALDERKNVPLVWEAVQRLDGRAGLVLAGSQADGVTSYIDSLGAGQVGDSLRLLNRRLSDAELDAVLQDLDCVVLAYSNTGPSGLIGKAAVAGTRVLAADCKELAKDCDVLGEGAAVSTLDSRHLSEAMTALMSTARPRRLHLDASDFVSKLLLP